MAANDTAAMTSSPDDQRDATARLDYRAVVSRSVAQALFVTGVVLILSMGRLFEPFDRVMLDLFVRADDKQAWQAGNAGSSQVVIASLPESEFNALRSGQGAAREALSQKLLALARAGARATVINVALTTPGRGDEALSEAIAEAGNVVLKSVLETPRPTQYGMTLPVRLLRNAAAGYGYSYWAPDSDGVVRRFPAALPGGFELSLPVVAYAVATDREPGTLQADLRFHRQIRNRGDVDREYQARLSFPAPPDQGFATFDYDKLAAALGWVRDKVVVIGPMDAGAAGMMTPLAESWRENYPDRWPEPMSVTELLAAAIDTLLTGRLIHDVPTGWFLGSLLLLAFAASLGAELLPPRPALVTCLSAGVLWTIAGRISYAQLHELPVCEGWAAVLACFGMGIYHRLGRDVARHQRQAWAAESERRRLADMDTAKRAVIGTVVHDLKVPVSIIKGQALTLAHDPERELGGELHQEFLETIAGQCDRLDAMIEDILDVDPDRKVTLLRQPADLKELVCHAVSTHEATVSRHTFEVVAEPLPEVAADPGKLTRVVNNLLSNAVKYSPDGGQVTVRLAPSGPDEVTIAVHDPGIGMTPEQVDRLFGLFVRVLDDPNEIPGTGVGLYSVKHLVELHGGRVTVESTPGEGSTFTVHLPVAEPQQDRSQTS